jgi:hypothetical protein
MRVLVACEFSGHVRDAFRARGHHAVSVDLLPTESPGHHVQGDAIALLGDGWDLLIAHPPCTTLANSGVRWLHSDPSRWERMREAAAFFRAFVDAPIPRIAIENPVMHRHAREAIFGGTTLADHGLEKFSVQPFEHGHPESKRTCFWTRGLAPLRPTRTLPLPACGHWENQTPSGQNRHGPSADRWKVRASTFTGIAQAMAAAWG